MELSVQHLVGDSFFLQLPAEILGSVDIDGAYQHRLPLLVSLRNVRYHGIELLFLGLIHHVIVVHSGNRHIGGNFHHVHLINLAELLFLRDGSTSHARLFRIFVKEILEGNRGEGFTLPLYLHMLLRFNRLVQSVREPPARHDAPGKLVHDQHFVIIYHIILILEHQGMGPKCQINIVLQFQIIRVCQILHLEEPLRLAHALLGQIHILVLLIDNIISRLLLFLIHQDIHLGKFFRSTPGQLLHENIASLVQLGGLSTGTGNNQRRPGLVNQHGIHLIDDSIVQVPLHQFFFVYHHIVPQIIKSQFVVGGIGDIAVIRLSSLIVVHIVENHAHGQAQKLMNLSHPLRITLCQIVIHRNDMHALSFQGIQICWQGRY